MRSSRMPDKAQAERRNMIIGCGLVLLAFFILDVAIRPIQLLGTVLVLMGVYVVSRAKA